MSKANFDIENFYGGCMAQQSFSLLMGDINKIYIIDGLRGNEKNSKYLHEIGFINGEKIKIFSKNKKGLIVGIKSGRLALDSSICKDIFIKELTNQSTNEFF